MDNFKQRFGTWCSLNSVNAVDVICSTDLDFVIIDEEHSSVSFEGMENMVRACEARGKQAIIRSSNDDKQHLLRILEAGSNALMVPHISSANDAKKVVEFVKYPPKAVEGYHHTQDNIIFQIKILVILFLKQMKINFLDS